MIPYFQFTTISLAGISIQVWGTFVAIGLLIGMWTSARFAKRRGLDAEHIYDAAFWIFLTSFIGARIVHILFYDLNFYASNPEEIIAIWHGGFSVIGGFVGAIAAFVMYTKRKRLNWRSYVDPFIYGLPLGLGIGRIGCFLIHDHPGTATDFFLGVKNQSGVGAFHDHGLYLSVNAFVLAFVFYVLAKKPRSAGFFAQVFLIWYGIVRFTLDFWRTVDATYFGVTPAQYVSFAMAVTGIVWMMKSKRTTDSNS
jgi:phosphatidylglycerol---prolipoprotein diacylglyceryl transferase